MPIWQWNEGLRKDSRTQLKFPLAGKISFAKVYAKSFRFHFSHVDGPCGSAVHINPLSCPKMSVWWEEGETCTLSTEETGDTWALFGLTALSFLH